MFALEDVTNDKLKVQARMKKRMELKNSREQMDACGVGVSDASSFGNPAKSSNAL